MSEQQSPVDKPRKVMTMRDIARARGATATTASLVRSGPHPLAPPRRSVRSAALGSPGGSP